MGQTELLLLKLSIHEYWTFSFYNTFGKNRSASTFTKSRSFFCNYYFIPLLKGIAKLFFKYYNSIFMDEAFTVRKILAHHTNNLCGASDTVI